MWLCHWWWRTILFWKYAKIGSKLIDAEIYCNNAAHMYCKCLIIIIAHELHYWSIHYICPSVISQFSLSYICYCINLNCTFNLLIYDKLTTQHGVYFYLLYCFVVLSNVLNSIRIHFIEIWNINACGKIVIVYLFLCVLFNL